MRRKSFEKAPCPVARSLDMIGDWWSLLIIRDALVGIRRFGDFQRSLGMAKNILTTRLRTMVAQGIMDVVPASDGSAYQEYVLTMKGQALLPVMEALQKWGTDYLFSAKDKPKVTGSVSLEPVSVPAARKKGHRRTTKVPATSN